MVYGFHPVTTLISNKPERVGKVFLKKGLRPSVMESTIAELKTKEIPWELKDLAFFTGVLPEGGHQGIIALLKKMEYLQEEDLMGTLSTKAKIRNIVCLDQIQDPRNLGAIVRSGIAFGFGDYILAKNGQARVGEAAWKSSAGTIVFSRLYWVTNLGRVLLRLKEYGYWVLGLDPSGASPLDAIQMLEPRVLVIGSEHSGIRSGLQKKCDASLSIPTDSRVESLNVASAASIAFYSLSREKMIDKSENG
jgi:23S rRNA (guanosine2251-2'-O)-methyltransferase